MNDRQMIRFYLRWWHLVIVLAARAAKAYRFTVAILARAETCREKRPARLFLGRSGLWRLARLVWVTAIVFFFLAWLIQWSRRQQHSSSKGLQIIHFLNCTRASLANSWWPQELPSALGLKIILYQGCSVLWPSEILILSRTCCCYTWWPLTSSDTILQQCWQQVLVISFLLWIWSIPDLLLGKHGKRCHVQERRLGRKWFVILFSRSALLAWLGSMPSRHILEAIWPPCLLFVTFRWWPASSSF